MLMVDAKNNAKMEREVGGFFQAEDETGRVISFDSSASLSHHHAYKTDTWHYEGIGPSFNAFFQLPLTYQKT